jgi:integrase
MCSTGIRVGAWEFMKWKHITPIYDSKNPDVVIAAKLVVYDGEPEEYQTFMTPEAYQALKTWMDFRKSYGEKITGDSWVMRNIWRTTDVKRGMVKHTDKNDNFYARATSPVRLFVDSIKRILVRALSEQGIRNDLGDGVRRQDFKTAHGMRKYYKTRAEQVMNRLNVEFLLGHSIGLNSNYYRPTEQELLTDYLKAVLVLTINDQNVESLKQHQEQKDKEIEELKAKIDSLDKMFGWFKEAMAEKIGEQQGYKVSEKEIGFDENFRFHDSRDEKQAS